MFTTHRDLVDKLQPSLWVVKNNKEPAVGWKTNPTHCGQWYEDCSIETNTWQAGTEPATKNGNDKYDLKVTTNVFIKEGDGATCMGARSKKIEPQKLKSASNIAKKICWWKS